MSWGYLHDLDTGERLRAATAVEASCWAMLQRSGVSYMVVEDEATRLDHGLGRSVTWRAA